MCVSPDQSQNNRKSDFLEKKLKKVELKICDFNVFSEFYLKIHKNSLATRHSQHFPLTPGTSADPRTLHIFCILDSRHHYCPDPPARLGGGGWPTISMTVSVPA